MKKNEMLEAMRKCAVVSQQDADFIGMTDRYKKDVALGGLIAMMNLANVMFGYGSEEHEEFKIYVEKRYIALPEKKA